MAGKLHELLAVEGDLEGIWRKVLAEALNTFTKKKNHFIGFVRPLVMFADERQKENTTEQVARTTTVREKLAYVWVSTIRYFNAIAQKESTNQTACADLVVGGKVLLPQMPATLLLGLESRLRQVREVYAGIPTLPPGIEWKLDPSVADDVYKSEVPEEAFKTEKVFRAQVLYEAKFPKDGEGGSSLPAQVEKIAETVNIGLYKKTYWAGMLSTAEKSELLEKVDELLRSVKQARQRANSTKIVKLDIGQVLYDYIHKP